MTYKSAYDCMKETKRELGLAERQLNVARDCLYSVMQSLHQEKRNHETGDFDDPFDAFLYHRASTAFAALDKSTLPWDIED